MCNEIDHKDCKKRIKYSESIEQKYIKDNSIQFNPINIEHFIIGQDENKKDVYECITCGYGPTINREAFRKHTKVKKHKLDNLKIGETPKYLYNCEPCNYQTDIKSKFKEHELTKGHIENELNINNTYKKSKYKHSCKPCKYETNRKDEHEEHLKSDKHNIKIGKPLFEKTFKCPKDNCPYIARTQQHLDNHINSRTHNMTIEEKKQFRKEVGIKNQSIGYEIENYINDIILSFDNIKSSKLIGYTGNIYDIKYKLKNEEISRYLQVKTITKNYPKDGYSINLKHKYDDDTLIIGTNHERDLFVSVFGKNVKSTYIGYNPNSKSNKYFYTDQILFMNKLKNDLKYSTSLSHEIEGLNKKQKKEFCSLYRLKCKCKIFELKYEPNKNINKEIDCFIDEFKIQHKSSSYRHFSMARKSSNKERPYSDKDDIDFFVFEYIDKENRNDFFIIPMRILIKKGYIKTDKSDGCVNISLMRKENGKRKGENKWTLNYLNRFDYFKIHKILKFTLNIKLINIIMIYV